MHRVNRIPALATSLAGMLLAPILFGSTGCFLPPWDERPWVGDDDTAADDDTGDDDTAAPDQLEFTGILDMTVVYPGVVNAQCQTPLIAEYTISEGTLEGETSCQLAQLDVEFELDADINGTVVSGVLEISDGMQELPVALEAAVTGTYDPDQGRIVGQADLNWYGVVAQGNFTLDAL